MALPVIISAATIGYSMFFPDGNLGSLTETSTSSRAVVPSTRSGGVGPFFYGILIGMGLSSWATYEFRRKRVLERARLAFFSWLYDSEEDELKLIDKFRKPVNVEDLEGDPITEDEGTDSFGFGVRRDLVSPDWAITSSLCVTVLSLPPGTELVVKRAEAVEFYYIIKGEGNFSSGKDTSKITIGDAFVVDPGCERGFVAGGRGDLLLLRATDAPIGDGHDATRLQASSLSSTYALVSAGLKKVENMFFTYYAKRQKSDAEISEGDDAAQ